MGEDKRVKELEKENSLLLKKLGALEKENQNTIKHNFGGKRTRIGVISDTHIGNYWSNPQLNEDLIKHFHKRSCPSRGLGGCRPAAV